MNTWKIICTFCLAVLIVVTTVTKSFADEKPFRLGIIGLDTSHVPNFTRYINDPANETGCKVVAAYRGGSPDIPSSANRLDMYTKQLKEQYGVEIVDSIEELCKKADGILLESVDGRPHLEQARPVFAAGKPVFIDKPVAGSLADAVEIFKLAKESGVPCWTSSTWRFTEGVQAVKKGKAGDVVGCIAYGPCALEPHHPDFYWYGIHTAETLFTLMGTGCETVSRTASDAADVAVGQWEDGRIGIFRGQRHAGGRHGFVAFGSKGTYQKEGHPGGYPVLLREIVKFFKTGKAPVSQEETLEIFAFMSAADESKAQGGKPVRLDEVLKKAQAEVEARTLRKNKSVTNQAKNKKKLRVVFFGAHCDDSELAAGGLMRMLADQGHEVISAYATTFRGERKFFGRPEDTVRRAESSAACKILGTTPHFFPYDHAELENPFPNVKTLNEILEWLNEVKPDIVVAHWPLDTHPNHQAVGMSTWMAYDHLGRSEGEDHKQSWNVYYYETNTFTDREERQTIGFRPNVYVDVEAVRDTKKKAIECLKSQTPEELWKIHDNMHTERGKQCGAKYAEAFVLVEAKPGCPLLPVKVIKKK